MRDKETVSFAKEKISEISLKENFGSTLSPVGTLIMSCKLTVGRVSILGIDAVHNEAIISIFPYISENNNIRDRLYYILGIIVTYVNQTYAIKGSTLNKDKMSSMLIPLPPIKEQRRIINKINSFEPLIQEYEKCEKQLTELESTFADKLKKSILQYAIEGKLVKQDPNDEPASVLLERIRTEKEKLIKDGKIKRDKNESHIYKGDDKNYYKNLPVTIPLGNLISVSSGKSIKVNQLTSDGLYPVYGGNGIVGKCNEFLVGPNTIVIGRVGAKCGCVHKTATNSFVSDNALIVTLKTKQILIDYLILAFRNINFNNLISSTAQPLISGKLIYPIEIPIYPLNKQKEILVKLNNIFNQFDFVNN